MNYFTFLKRIFFKSGLPMQLFFYVASKCDFSCRHCFLKEKRNPPANELSLAEIDQWTQTLSPLLWLCLTGGEPFLREDLPEIAKLFYQNTRVAFLSIPTNGFATEHILSQSEKIASFLPRTQIIIHVSLDGFKETHDQIRQRTGSYEHAVRTLKNLRSLQKNYKNLKVASLSTFMLENQNEFGDFLNFMQKDIQPDLISVNLIRQNTINDKNPDLARRYFRTVAGFKKAAIKQMPFERESFFKKILLAKDLVLSDLVRKIHNVDHFKINCYAGRLSAVVYENGEVFPCEILTQGFGNLRVYDMDFRLLWNTELARQIRRQIRSTKCTCAWECALNTSIIFNPRYYPQLLLKFISMKDNGRIP